jgi:hypothetical protein
MILAGDCSTDWGCRVEILSLQFKFALFLRFSSTFTLSDNSHRAALWHPCGGRQF